MLKRLLSLVLAALIAVPAPALPAQVAPPSIERPVAHGAGDAGPALPRLAQRLSDTIPPLYMLGGDDKIAPVAQGNFVQASYALNKASLDSVATFSRAGLATQFDSSGYLTYGPNNLLLNTATLGTQTVTVQVGVNYILSIKGTGSVTLTGASTAGPLNGTGASNRVDLKITAATTSLTLTVSGSVTSARLSAVTYETAFRTQDDVDTTSAAYYGPRFDYTYNGSSWVPAGLLIEEARTNLVLNSGALTGAEWSTSTTTIGSDATVDLTGATAVRLTASSGLAIHQIFPTVANVSVTNGTTYVASWNLKAGTHRYLNVQLGSSANWSAAVFDLNGTSDTTATQTGSATDTAVSGSAKYMGNGWFRVSLKFTAGATESRYAVVTFVGAATGNTFGMFGNVTWTAAGTETVYIGQPQNEAGSFATSYIPTAASSVTRAADVVQFTGAALTALQGSAWTALVETGPIVDYVVATTTILGANNLQTPLYVGDATHFASYNGSSVLLETIGNSGNFLTGSVRSGVSTNASGRSIVANGGAVSSDGNMATPVAVTSVYLGSFNGERSIGGPVKSFAIYNQRLSDATLQAKSVVGASYAANDNVNPFAPQFAANDNLPVHWRIAL